MSAELAVRTPLDVANRICWELDLPHLTLQQFHEVAWEHTGFPEFWMGEPMACLESQLWDFFVLSTVGMRACACCGGISADWLCGHCSGGVDR